MKPTTAISMPDQVSSWLMDRFILDTELLTLRSRAIACRDFFLLSNSGFGRSRIVSRFTLTSNLCITCTAARSPA